MEKLPLQFKEGHLFVKIGGDLWLIDTGAPSSFGKSGNLAIYGKQFKLSSSYQGLDAETLSNSVKVPCAGLLGADLLSCFDHIFDIAGGILTLSTDELQHAGQSILLTDLMGIPIVTVRIDNKDFQMFFDTGAQISYFQNASLTKFPSAGRINDFFPGFGAFKTDTYDVPVLLGPVAFTLRCGVLPDLLGMALMGARMKGIVGNAILLNRIVGYFPRRGMLIL